MSSNTVAKFKALVLYFEFSNGIVFYAMSAVLNPKPFLKDKKEHALKKKIVALRVIREEKTAKRQLFHTAISGI